MKNITIIGIGMGNPDTITLEGQKHIEKAEVLIGGNRMIETFQHIGKPSFASIYSEEIANYIKSSDFSEYAVLMSGDTGFYSGTSSLIPLLQDFNTKVIPGISSLSYFCSKLAISWEDIHVISLHGRETNLVGIVKEHHKTFALTGGNIKEISEKLTLSGLGDVTVFIGENLSYPHERITKGLAKELIYETFSSISVVLIINPMYEKRLMIGIPDDEMIRGKVPMTKSEVRAISISKLQLKENFTMYDIGAGTGSVSVEAAYALKSGRVYAIEYKDEAVKLIEANKEKFTLDNIEIIKGIAPEVLEELPMPDVVFIGGSKGNIKSIIDTIIQKNKKVRFVVNAITIETVSETLNVFKENQVIGIEVIQVGISKTDQIGDYHMLMGQNPVFIISGGGILKDHEPNYDSRNR